MITITPYQLPDIWTFGGSTAKLCIYADLDFKEVGSELWKEGSNQKWYRVINCAIVNKRLIIPEAELPTTTDSDVPFN